MPVHRAFTSTLVLLVALTTSGLAMAVPVTYTNETAFVSGTGSTTFESFETLPGSSRTPGASVVAPLVSVTSLTAPMGVNTGPATPDDAFGAVATDGSHFLSVYAPNLSPGTIRFDFASPTNAFGLNLTDLFEAAGSLVLRTNVGEFSSGVTVFNSTGGLANSNVLFFGLSQDVAFTQLFLTVQGGIDEAFGIDKVYVSAPAAIPEPSSALLLMAGLAAWGGLRSRQRRG
jgi:PEP-CTERM motif